MDYKICNNRTPKRDFLKRTGDQINIKCTDNPIALDNLWIKSSGLMVSFYLSGIEMLVLCP